MLLSNSYDPSEEYSSNFLRETFRDYLSAPYTKVDQEIN